MPERRKKAALGPGAKAFERAIAEAPEGRFILHLYVSGMTPRSRTAIANLQKLCEQHLPGRYELQIIDIYQQPHLAKAHQVIAAPTLVKKLPLPLRKLVGDLADAGRVLLVLGLAPEPKGAGQ